MAKVTNNEERKSGTEVRTQKTEEEFIGDLTSTDKECKEDEKGLITIEGGFPQVIRKPLVDKTVNGFKRTSY